MTHDPTPWPRVEICETADERSAAISRAVARGDEVESVFDSTLKVWAVISWEREDEQAD